MTNHIDTEPPRGCAGMVVALLVMLALAVVALVAVVLWRAA